METPTRSKLLVQLPQPDEFLSPFAETMALAEDLVIAANDSAMECVAIRRGWTWGPDDNEFLPEMLRRSRARELTVYGGAHLLVATTFIENLVHAIELAVIAHIRHRETNYDRLLFQGGDRSDARRAVQEKVEEILRRWRGS